MKSPESFPIFFQHKCFHAGIVQVRHSPGFYYFSLFIDDQEKIFFVDDEKDRWIENNAGATALANRVGEAIDRYFHPSLASKNPPINPDQSRSFI